MFMYRLVLILFLYCAITGCSSDDAAHADNLISTIATIEASAQLTEDGRIVVTGQTNLPDQSELMVSMGSDTLRAYAQSTSTVTNGRFNIEPLGGLSGLDAALYSIDISISIPASQSEYVTGPLISTSAWGFTSARYSFTYQVGSDDEVLATATHQAKKVSDIRGSLMQLLEAGYAMQSVRMKQTYMTMECGVLMRKYQAETELIESKLDELSPNYLKLRNAAANMYRCVSCLDSAITRCQEIEARMAE